MHTQTIQQLAAGTPAERRRFVAELHDAMTGAANDKARLLSPSPTPTLILIP